MKMKRFYLVLTAVLLAAILSACTDSGAETAVRPNEDQQRPEVEAAVNPGSDILSGSLAYDITELLGPEPFAADGIAESMPIYKNRFVTDGAGVPLEPISRDEMWRIGREIADVLGVEVESEANYSSGNHLALLCGEISIEIDGSGSAYVEFGKTYPLSVKQDDANESLTDALDYTAEVLKPLLSYWNIETPEASIVNEYSFGGENMYRCSLIGKGGNRKSVSVFISDGYLTSVRNSYKPSADDILGEYPTISYEEAKEMLLDGQYYSFMALEEPILLEKIEGASIGYKTQYYDEVFLPFYIFYVDVTDREEMAVPEESKKLGLKMYTSCVVPAIKPEYLKQFPEIVMYFN